MKIKRILAALAAAASLFACKPDDVVEKPTELSVSPSSVTFEADGGTLRVAVTTNADAYNVSGAPAWLKVEQSGKEIALTAEQNTVNEARNATLTVTAKDKTAKIEVSQKAGSPYFGYTMMTRADFEYSGTLLYQFMKPEEGYDGGQGYLTLHDEDDNSITAWIYTDLFKSADEVELTTGKYEKGGDAYFNLKARRLTYMAGEVVELSDDEEDESYVAGSYYTNRTAGTDTPLTEGTIEISKDADGFVIKVDMKDAAGHDYKYVYMGDVEIDKEGAGYPGTNERIDVTENIIGADCFYYGDYYENGTSRFELCIYSGDENNPAMTNFEFISKAVEFEEGMNLSGTFTSPSEGDEEEGPVEPYSAGTIVNGQLMEMMGFEIPMGTYIMYSFGDYLIGDAYNSLILDKQADGTYSLMGSITSTKGEFVLFMGIEGLEINVYDGTEDYD